VGIRQEVLACNAFRELKSVYDNREKVLLEQKAQGKKIVARLGCDVPDELVLAAGLFPVQVYADPQKVLTETDRYLEYAFDPVVRAQFEKIVDGTYEELADYLVVSNSTDTIIRIYLYLREIRRIEPEKKVPEVEFIDWLFTRNRLHQVRNEHTLGLFKETLEGWSGREITEDAVQSAAELCNRNRAALRRMAVLRHGEEVRITGSEALVIIGAGMFMEKSEHTRLVEAVTEAAKDWPVLTDTRLFFTGSNQESTELYDLIESTGGVIVGEDHDWGDRYYDRDYNLNYPMIRAVVDRYMLREFSSKKAYVSQRVEAILREVETVHAEKVVFATNQYEEAASWDYPSQKEALGKLGIPMESFAKLLYPLSKNEGLYERIEAFVAGDRKGAGS